MKKLHILIAALAVAVVAGGVGYAAIPSADGTISACKDSTGALKVIDAEAGETCRAGQELLTWNQGAAHVLSNPISALASSAFNSTDKKVVMATCPDGTRAMSGGGWAAYPYGNGEQLMPGVGISLSRSEGNGWSVAAQEMVPTTESWTLVASASCVSIS